CDLFRDNVLFDGTYESPRLGGIIDFYFAGCDSWLFDVAVTANDWCIHRETGAFIEDRLQALLAAYAEHRPFTPEEREAWPMMLQAGALRFWVSRLYDYFLPRPAQTLKPHDPRHFERVVRLRRETPAEPLPWIPEPCKQPFAPSAPAGTGSRKATGSAADNRWPC